MSMQTRCPNCETVFRLTDAQLAAANGKVRCGLCHHIFTASSIDDAPASDAGFVTDDETRATETITAPEQDTEYKDAFFDENLIEDESDEPDQEEIQEESNAILLSEIEARIIPEEYRTADRRNDRRFSTLLWSIGIVFFLTTLVSEYAWFNRDQLVQDEELEPWIHQFCDMTGCTLAPVRKPELIEMVNRDVYTHPNIKQALMISATMVNKAKQAQAYPDIEIGFSNVRGKVIAQRIFTPREYMKVDEKKSPLLQPEKPVTFGLEIQDPGKQAMTYEFNFL